MQQKETYLPTDTNLRGDIKTAQIDTSATCMESPRKFITRAEASVRYHLSIRKIDSMIEAGTLPAARISRRCIRIPVQKADAAILRKEARK